MLVFSMGINFFIVPAGLYNGGLMGISQVIRTLLVQYVHLFSGTTDIADKTGIIVERANEIKEKAEAARIAADKLQQNVEHFIV